jgi:hypothetical protein
MKQVVLYGAPECHLCETAKAKLARVRRVVPFDLREVDVWRDPDLRARFGSLIPVVAIDGCDALVTKVTEFRLLKALLSPHPPTPSPSRGEGESRTERDWPRCADGPE